VAIKTLNFDIASDPAAVARFVREARILSKFSHPNIVTLLDAGYHNGLFYYAMEFAEGQTLAQILADKGHLEWAQALKIVKQVAKALEHASEAGVVHRDIKPDNLIVSEDGAVKLTDMGVAKAVLSAEDLERDATFAGNVAGTVDYMSPEQVDNEEDIDVRSDIYSLGVTFYALLKGEPPFRGDNLVTAANMRLRKDVPFQRLKDLAPESVLAIGKKMTMRKREERYQTPRRLLDEIHIVEAESTTSGVVLQASAKPTIRRRAKPKPHRNVWILILSLAGAAVLGAAVSQLAAPLQSRADPKADPVAKMGDVARLLAKDTLSLSRARRFAEARARLSQARAIFPEDLWKVMVDAQTDRLEADILAAFRAAKSEAFELRSGGSVEEGRRKLQAVREWKLSDLDAELDKAFEEYDKLQKSVAARLEEEDRAHVALNQEVFRLLESGDAEGALERLRRFEADCIQDHLRKKMRERIAEVEAVVRQK
jgi:hypothetical protein